MKLIAPVNIPKSNFLINHDNPITLIGSCFSQNIGDKLKYHKFKVNPNFFGTVFNPISIANNLSRLIEKQLYTTADFYIFQDKKIVNFNNQFSSFKNDIEQIVKEENSAFVKEIEHFKSSKTLILTFGTAWVYEFNETKKIVANCHKIPNTNFTKRILGVKEIVEVYQSIIEQLKHYNIIFTVSPVRHSKDGLHENNLSKATLHLAINKLTEQFKNCNYFPAYELVIDELRDYRFYKDDLVHPTDLAVNYVWEKFTESYFSEETNKLNQEIAKIQTALNHKPSDADTKAHQEFLAKTQKQISEIQLLYPNINFD